jgi:hypothetical protein
MPIRQIAFIAGAVLIAAAAPTLAQTPSPFVDKGGEKVRIQQEALGKKWSSCRKQAKAQKITWHHRKKFMDDCMAR